MHQLTAAETIERTRYNNEKPVNPWKHPMSPIKAELLKTLETAPEATLEATLNFLKTHLRAPAALPPSSGQSPLRHAGRWQGDDFEDCLQSVYDTRSAAQF